MISKALKVFVLAALLVAVIQSPAFAYGIKFVNYSGYTVNGIYIFDENTWRKVCYSVYNGKSTSFYFSEISSNAPLWDIQVKLSNGRTVNLTKIDFYFHRRVVFCQDANSSSGFCLYLERY